MKKEPRDYAKEIAAINLRLKQFLTASAEELGKSLPPTSIRSIQGRSKLSNLTDHQLYELCVDVHDEFRARSPGFDDSDEEKSLIIPQCSLNARRLQARQKLSTLSDERCRDLLYDITLEISKRGYGAKENNNNNNNKSNGVNGTTQQSQNTSEVSKTESNTTSTSSRPYSPLLLPAEVVSSSSSVMSDTSEKKHCSVIPLRPSQSWSISNGPINVGDNDDRRRESQMGGIEESKPQEEGTMEEIGSEPREEDVDNNNINNNNNGNDKSESEERQQQLVEDEIDRLIQEDGLIPIQIIQHLNQQVVRSYELVNNKSFNESDDFKIDLFRTVFEISKVVSQLLEMANFPEFQNEIILLKTSLSSAITSIRYFTVYGDLLLPKITVHAALADISYAVCNLISVAKLRKDKQKEPQRTSTKNVKGAIVHGGTISREKLKDLMLVDDAPMEREINVKPFKLSEKLSGPHANSTTYGDSSCGCIGNSNTNNSTNTPATSSPGTSNQHYKSETPSNSPITRSLNFFKKYQHHNLSHLKASRGLNTSDTIKDTERKAMSPQYRRNKMHETLEQHFKDVQFSLNTDKKEAISEEKKINKSENRFSWEPAAEATYTGATELETVVTPINDPRERRTSIVKVPASAPRQYRESPIKGMQSMFRYKSMMDHHRMAVGREKVTRDASFSEKVRKFGDGKGHGLGLAVVDGIR